MCCLACKPKEDKMKEEWLDSMWESNPHGGGIAYSDGKTCHIIKGLMTKDVFIKAALKHQDKDLMIHTRFATHGARDGTMTHPFALTYGKKKNQAPWVLGHNGVISPLRSDSKMSDTAIFAEEILKPVLLNLEVLDENVIHGLRWLVEESIRPSKVALLCFNGVFVIFNKSSGEEEGNIWFSNNDYKIERVRTSTTTRSTVPYTGASRGYGFDSGYGGTGYSQRNSRSGAELLDLAETQFVRGDIRRMIKVVGSGAISERDVIDVLEMIDVLVSDGMSYGDAVAESIRTKFEPNVLEAAK